MQINSILRKGFFIGIVFLFIGINSSPVLCHDFSRDDNDTTPPVTTATLAPEPNENGWYNDIVWVTLSAIDNESGVNVTYYRINGKSWITYTEKFYVFEIGMCIVEFYSIDNAGNAEIPKQAEFKIDPIEPLTTCALNPPNPDGTNGWYICNITVTLNATDSLSGVNVTYYIANGNSEQIYTGPFVVFKGMSFGFYSIDNAGNREPTHTKIFKMDRGAPVGIFHEKKMYNKINLSVVADDNLSGVSHVDFYCNGKVIRTTYYPFESDFYPFNFISIIKPFTITGFIGSRQISENNVSFITRIVVLLVGNMSLNAMIYDNAGNYAWASNSNTADYPFFLPPFYRLVLPRDYTGYLGRYFIYAIY